MNDRCIFCSWVICLIRNGDLNGYNSPKRMIKLFLQNVERTDHAANSLARSLNGNEKGVWALPWMGPKSTTCFIVIVSSFTCRPRHGTYTLFAHRHKANSEVLVNLEPATLGLEAEQTDILSLALTGLQSILYFTRGLFLIKMSVL